MKKLVIVAAVVMMAVCSQAASYKWSGSSLTDYAGSAISDVMATIYCSETAQSYGSVEISSGGFSQQLLISDDFKAGNYYNFYITYTDAEGNKFTSALKKSKAQTASTPSLSFKMTGGTWTPAPEPTSAMLMLLGMAGLALRRRRA